jgi:hypothetical protein
LQQLKSWCQSILESGQSLLLAGDFNVAPSPEDASCQQDAPKDAPAPLPQLWAPWCHPQMRAALGDLLSVGLTDLGAAETRRAPQWTMWDERNFGPDTQLGVRVDLLLGSLAMEARLLQAGVHSSMRQGIKPSDHVPVYGIFRPVQRIFGALSGSRLYGLATARSDTDIKGLMLPSPDDLLLGQVQKVEHLQRRKNAGEKNNALDVDVEFYSPTHFVSLLLAGQPMAWELLYAPPACHTPDTTPVGLRFMARLREHSDRLWCQNLSATLGFVERHVQSYLRRQMGPHKAPVATFVPGPLTPVGEHGKLLSHALRVLQQAQEMFDTGTMIFPRANAVQLRQIKEGQGLAQGVLADIDAARATLLQSAQHSAFAPHPDHGLALGLVRDLHDRHLAVSRWLKAPPRLLAVDGRPLRQRPPGPSALLQALSLEGAPQSAALEQIL